ncbi:hypothetical protein O6H91_16G038400 [Diphasiastrum complanatum]|uniref:Uncharacterized protein n=1 Tax=Diphasiastrum complanatum TaxID=34168 RepID=A0ACC2BBH5_DIPCM|nr:hypothetical protein O6H91_16G038400 [Diphasiastrum complanatum]
MDSCFPSTAFSLRTVGSCRHPTLCVSAAPKALSNHSLSGTAKVCEVSGIHKATIRKKSSALQVHAAVGSTVNQQHLDHDVRGIGSTLYDLLGVSQSATIHEIKVGFRRMAKIYHPDRAAADEIEEHHRRFLEIHNAYSVLKDPCSRSMYDTQISSTRYCKHWLFESGHCLRGMGFNWESDQCW